MSKLVPISSKVALYKKGDFTIVESKTFKATLKWKTAIDLDLHAVYRKKMGGMFRSGPSNEGCVYFENRGVIDSFPFIRLDLDAGVGDKEGNNEENIEISDINKHDLILILANIFDKEGVAFSSFGAKVTISIADGSKIVIPLTEKRTGSWLAVALIDNRMGIPSVTNLNKVSSSMPQISYFI